MFATVFLGFLVDGTASGKQIAVKCFTEHTQAAANEIKYLKTFAEQNATNIVKILGSQYHKDNKVTVAIELAMCSLKDLIDRPENITGLNQNVMIDLICDTYNGAESLSQLTIAHRDIKPGNILVFRGPVPSSNNQRRSSYLFKYCDVGCAKQHHDNSMHTVIGTAGFIIPEMALKLAESSRLKRLDEPYTALQCDFWSLGCTLFIAATAQLPFPLVKDETAVYAEAPESILKPGKQQITLEFKLLSLGQIKHGGVRPFGMGRDVMDRRSIQQCLVAQFKRHELDISVELSKDKRYLFNSSLPTTNCSKWFSHCVAVLIRMMLKFEQMHIPDMNFFRHIAEALRDSCEYTFESIFYSLTNLEIVKYCDLSQDSQLGSGFPALLPQIVFDGYEGDIAFISKKTGAVITCKSADMDITLLDSNNTYVVFPKKPKFPAKTWIDKPLEEIHIDTDLMKLMYHRKGIALGIRALRDCKDFIFITKNSTKTLNRFIDALFKRINELLNKIELISTINAYSGSQCQAFCLLTSGDNKKLGMNGNSSSVKYGDDLGYYQGKIGEVENRLREILLLTQNLELTNVDDLHELQEELNGTIKQSGDVNSDSYRNLRSNHLVQNCLTKRLQLINQMRGSNITNPAETPLVKRLLLLINELLGKQSVIEDIEKKVSECSKLVQIPLEKIRSGTVNDRTDIDPRDLNSVQFNMSQWARLSDRSREIRELVSRLGNLIPDVEEN